MLYAQKGGRAMKHAKRSGWRPFWAALCAALLVLAGITNLLL